MKEYKRYDKSIIHLPRQYSKFLQRIPNNWHYSVLSRFFITKNGYGDLVVMSIETYEQMVETQIIDNAISEAEEEYEATGILLDAKETLASFRRKHLG